MQRFQRLCPQAEIVDISMDLRQLRMVKSADEVASMRQASTVLAQVPALLREHFVPGMSELALSAALEYAFRRQGHDALIRARREGMDMSACGRCASGVRTLAGSKF